MQQLNNIFIAITITFTLTTYSMNRSALISSQDEAQWIQQQELEQLEDCSPTILRASEYCASCCSATCYISGCALAAGKLGALSCSSTEENIATFAIITQLLCWGEIGRRVETGAGSCLQELQRMRQSKQKRD